MGGVRGSVWIVLAGSAAFLAAALWWAGGEVSTEPVSPAAAPRRFAASPGPMGPQAARAGAKPAQPAPERAAREPAAALPPPRIRTGELVSLERDAAELAAAHDLVDPEPLERQLAELARAPEETREAFERRRDEERERLESEALLLQYRLSALFQSARYPAGFDVQHLVVDMERQAVAALPAEDRILELRRALESWEPRRARPVFGELLDPALEWRAPPDL